MSSDAENKFDAVFRIIWSDAAAFFASDLFSESFGTDFPVPVNLGADVSVADWHQCVALYRWPDGLVETVGFCNWIRYGEVYLEGGLCVKAGFYRRMPRRHWQACREQGGIAQLMMEFGAKTLNDAAAWFGYCGDKRAMIVDQRVGFEKTSYAHLIAKWLQPLSVEEKQRLCAQVAQLGAF